MKRVRDPQLIRDAMVRRDLTFREVALVAGCHLNSISHALNGGTINPKTALRIARFLRQPVAVLFMPAESSDKQSRSQRQAAS